MEPYIRDDAFVVGPLETAGIGPVGITPIPDGPWPMPWPLPCPTPIPFPCPVPQGPCPDPFPWFEDEFDLVLDEPVVVPYDPVADGPVILPFDPGLQIDMIDLAGDEPVFMDFDIGLL